MSEVSLFELVEKASNGDQKAFEEIIRLKSRTILFNSLSIIGKYQDAEDAAQEVILKMYKNIKGLKNPKAFNAWMQRIITNVCYSMGRKKKSRHEKLDFEDYSDQLVEEEKEFLPHEYVETIESQNMLKEIVDDLPEKRRRAIIMYYFDEMSYSEIAYAMNVTVSTVSTNILQAKRTIKDEMENRMGKEKKIAQGLAAVPVMSQVLNDQALEKITTAQVDKFAKTSIKMIRKISHPVLHKVTSVLKIIAVVSVSTVIVTSVILAATDNLDLNKDAKNSVNTSGEVQTSTHAALYKVNGNIVFIDGECDCGHLNPKDARIESVDVDYDSYSWEILNNEGGVVYSGGKEQMPEAFANLYRNKMDGTYTMKFILNVDGRDNVYLKRDFQIDTGEIKPGQYK